MSLLEQVERAVTEGRLPEALTLALADWRKTRAVVIAEAIEAISEKVVPKAIAVFSASRFHHDWLAAASAPDDVMVGILASSLTQRVPLKASYDGILDPKYALKKYAGLLDRVNALLKLPDDPRISKALLRLVHSAEQGVNHSAGARQVYGVFLAGLEQMRDVGAIGTLEELVREPRAKQEGIRSYFERALPETIAALKKVRVEKLDQRTLTGWYRLTVSRSPRAEEHEPLLASIYARPDDDTARLVYADWLLERGDVRGELITLQVQEAQGQRSEPGSKRIRALLRAHEAEWLGDPLRATLIRTVFRRGFLTEAALAQNASAVPRVWEAAPNDARLSTLSVLDKGRGSTAHYELFALSPHLQNLERLEVLRWPFLEALLQKRPRVPGLRLPGVPTGRLLRTTFEVLEACAVERLHLPVIVPDLPRLKAMLADRPFALVTLESGSMAGRSGLPDEAWLKVIEAVWPQISDTLRIPGFAVLRRGEGAPKIEVFSTRVDAKTIASCLRS